MKTMQTHDQTIPTLPSRSIEATVAFYHRLGFEGGAHEFITLKKHLLIWVV